jgi:roadblock/LC7 domain-containing protein
MKATEMTDQHLTAEARRYDNAMNEGGEGYNPYRDEINRRRHAAEAARVKTPEERIATLQRKIAAEDCSIARESGTYDAAKIATYRAEIAELRAQVVAKMAAAEETFRAEWTPEVTLARKHEWNAASAAGKMKTWAAIRDYERKVGYTMDDLKKAVKMNGLEGK